MALASAVAVGAAILPAAAPFLAALGLGAASVKTALGFAGLVGAIVTERKHLGRKKKSKNPEEKK